MPTMVKYRIPRTLRTLNYDYNNKTLNDILDADECGCLMNVRNFGEDSHICKILELAICNKFWYSEIGYDTDEEFIYRFHNSWNLFAPIFYDVLHPLFNDVMFGKIEEGYETKTLNDGYNMEQSNNSNSEDIRNKHQTDQNNLSSQSDTTESEKTAGERTDAGQEETSRTQEQTAKNFGSNIEITNQTESTNKTTSDSSTTNATDDITRSDAVSREITADSNIFDSNIHSGENKQTISRQNIGDIRRDYYNKLTSYDYEKLLELPKISEHIETFTDKFRHLFMFVYTN